MLQFSVMVSHVVHKKVKIVIFKNQKCLIFTGYLFVAFQYNDIFKEMQGTCFCISLSLQYIEKS